MARPPKRWPELYGGPERVQYGEDLVIPKPALRGLIRAILQNGRVSPKQRQQAESMLYAYAESLCKPQISEACTADVSPEKELSVATAAKNAEVVFHALQQMHPSLLIRVEAEFVIHYLEQNRFPVNARNDTTRKEWLRKFLPNLLTTLGQNKQCSDLCRARVRLPNDAILSSLAEQRTLATLRKYILAYRHDTSHETIQQLLSGR